MNPAPLDLRPCHVVELQGPPASGKTHLLYLLIVNCIIPPSHKHISLGGWGKAALVMDTDGTFRAARLRLLLRTSLARLLPDDTSLDEVTTACLERVRVFHPNSSTQLAATIAHLQAYHASRLPTTAVGLLAVDSMSAFYWPDRFTVEQLQSPSTDNSVRRSDPRTEGPLRDVLTALQSFAGVHNSLIILTNWGLYPIDNAALQPGTATRYSQHLRPFLPLSDVNLLKDTPPLQLTHRISLGYPSLSENSQITTGLARYKNNVTGTVWQPGRPSSAFILHISDDLAEICMQ